MHKIYSTRSSFHTELIGAGPIIIARKTVKLFKVIQQTTQCECTCTMIILAITMSCFAHDHCLQCILHLFSILNEFKHQFQSVLFKSSPVLLYLERYIYIIELDLTPAAVTAK